MRRPLVLAALTLALLGARKPDDPKHENHFAPTSTPAADGVTLGLVTAHAQAGFVLVEAKVANTTGDKVLVVRKEQGGFVLPNGTFPVKAGGLFGGPAFIQPGADKKIGWKAEGAAMHVESATLKLGGFAMGSVTGTVVAAPDFTLPAEKNDFTAGPYTCRLDKLKQKTDLTVVGFACQYNGAGMGIVDPTKASVRAPGGEIFANENRKTPRELLLPGDTAGFTLEYKIPAKVADMQFAKLQVVWDGVLADTPLAPVELGDWTFALDPAKTAAENE